MLIDNLKIDLIKCKRIGTALALILLFISLTQICSIYTFGYPLGGQTTFQRSNSSKAHYSKFPLNERSRKEYYTSENEEKNDDDETSHQIYFNKLIVVTTEIFSIEKTSLKIKVYCTTPLFLLFHCIKIDC